MVASAAAPPFDALWQNGPRRSACKRRSVAGRAGPALLAQRKHPAQQRPQCPERSLWSFALCVLTARTVRPSGLRHHGAMPEHAAPSPTALPPVFTVGHSTRPYAEFVALLQQHGVQCVVDVRKLAGSRRQPQYNADTLAQALAADGIGYVHMAALGGRRGRTLAPGALSPNGYWTNDSFRRYADYALSDAFAAGLKALQERSRTQRCALMCAEAVWWRCHRRIIADYLLLQGRTVCHILAANRTEPAHTTPGAVVQAPQPGAAPPQAAAQARLVYPAEAAPALAAPD